MQFHQYRNPPDKGWRGHVTDAATHIRQAVSSGADEQELMCKLYARTKLTPDCDFLQRNYLEACLSLGQWHYHRRPFYRIYPSVLEVIERFEIERVKTFTTVPTVDSVMIELPVGRETVFGDIPVANILLSFFNESIYLSMFDADNQFIFCVDDRPEAWSLLLSEPDRLLEEENKRLPQNECCPLEALEQILPVARLVAGILFLEKSPELFAPVVLQKDKEKYQAARDAEHRESLVNKALRNGVVGWEIGRNIPTRAEIAQMRKANDAAIKKGEKCPHIRCGHEIWVYSPPKHKTQSRGKSRTIPFGPRAQKILAPRLAMIEVNDYVFNMKDVREDLFIESRKTRKTKIYPYENKKHKN